MFWRRKRPKTTITVEVRQEPTKPLSERAGTRGASLGAHPVELALAHHNLLDWFHSTYTRTQRHEILHSKPFGDYAHAGQAAVREFKKSSAPSTLTFMAQYFKRTDRVHLGIPMLEKALTYNLNPQDEYYTLAGYIDQRYKQRADDPSAIDDVVKACERTIELIPALRTYWKTQHNRMEARSRHLAEKMNTPYERREWEGFPPGHVGLPRLIAIRKKQKQPGEVARLQQLYEELWLRHSMARDN